jgi:hypothetical protein
MNRTRSDRPVSTQSSPSFSRKQSPVERPDGAACAAGVLDVGADRQFTGMPAQSLTRRGVTDFKCDAMRRSEEVFNLNRHSARQVIKFGTGGNRHSRRSVV